MCVYVRICVCMYVFLKFMRRIKLEQFLQKGKRTHGHGQQCGDYKEGGEYKGTVS